MMQVMLERGIDMSRHRSKHLQDLEELSFDLVVTVCDDAAQTCPSFPQRKLLASQSASSQSGTAAHLGNHSAAASRPARVVHHSFDDPPRLAVELLDTAGEEAVLAPYRRVCEEIRLFVRDELPALLK